MRTVHRPRQLIVGAATLLVLSGTAGCTTETEAPATPSAAEATEAVTLDGATGTIELSGDADADIEALVPAFGREYTEGVACDPPEDPVDEVRWPGELRFITRQYDDWYAAEDAIRVTVHYDCPEHYDAVDDALA